MKTKIAIRPILIAFTALSILYGCKARQVKIKQLDSTTVSEVTKSSSNVETHKDTGKVETKTVITKTDSGTVEIQITPLPGKTITVNKDGSFTGEASHISVKNKKAELTNTNINTTEKKAVIDSLAKTEFETKKDSTHVKSKDKEVISKPSYKWIPYAIGAIIVLVILFLFYKKFKNKLPF